MRLESTKGENEFKVWLQPDEIDAMVEVAEKRSQSHKCLVMLGAWVSLRAEEYPLIRPKDVYREEGKWRITIWGKDTTGEMGDDGKRRDAYLSDEVERELAILQARKDLDDDEHYYPVTQARIRQMVHEIAEDVAEEIEEARRNGETPRYPGKPEDWCKVSSHDLRRFYAHHLLVRNGTNPRVVMKNGGWDSYEAIEPYLNEPTAEVVNDEMEDVFG